ncbi:hypothetical protein [Nocardia carnea]|uniref:hypothetical protein n=1 Tax=Nocardia carnea TaxID=37328 RepID=UPI0024538AE0|nr:hypothetical protein [Nocardia carnea]
MALEWLAVAGTLGGALLGAGSTMMVETLRARRERVGRLEETRRQVYVKTLTALTQTDTALQALAIEGPTPLGRAEATAAFRSHDLVATIYELELIAPEPVSDSAWEVYRRLRDIREMLIARPVVVERAGAGSPEWQAVHNPFLTALDGLRGAMRQAPGGRRRIVAADETPRRVPAAQTTPVDAPGDRTA